VRALFDVGIPSIEGFRYQGEFISREEELALTSAIRKLEFGKVVFRGVEARRRVAQFGWHYEFGSRQATRTEPVPDFLLALRKQAGELIGIQPALLEEVLVTEYQPGAGIGWHRDAPPFGIVIGVSLLSACKMRLRPRGGVAGSTVAIELAPRSIYVFDGAVRSDWEHSIPPAKELRYSVTFRTMTGGATRRR
jgi:alkylated DNA repair dioxygenase AlkB